MENLETLPSSSLNIIELIAQASFLVQMVMLLLLLASVISWAIIFKKWFRFRDLEAEADEFEDDFWSGGDLTRLYQHWTSEEEPTGMASLFVSGYREYTRLADKDLNRSELISGVQRAMQVSLSQEIEEVESQLPFLATVGSTSPYIGLFGTVWGIMNAFHAIGLAKQATIATVAPAIAEALIATAMGLFAAIPAVIAYNNFSNKSDLLITRYEIFMDEFLSIVNRQVRRDQSPQQMAN